MAEIIPTTVQDAVGGRPPVAVHRQHDICISCQEKDVPIRVESFSGADVHAALNDSVPCQECSDGVRGGEGGVLRLQVR